MLSRSAETAAPSESSRIAGTPIGSNPLGLERRAPGRAATPPKDARGRSLQGARGNRGPMSHTRVRRSGPSPESGCPRRAPSRFRIHERRQPRAGGESLLRAERALGPTEHSSCYAIDAQALIVERRCCVAQSLLEIFGLEKGVFGEQRSSVGIRREQLENATNGDPHRPDARLPTALSWLDRNPVEQVYRRHVPSLDHFRYRSLDSHIL